MSESKDTEDTEEAFEAPPTLRVCATLYDGRFINSYY
jgi:hypothetical protein